jgi:hypothetical protein
MQTHDPFKTISSNAYSICNWINNMLYNTCKPEHSEIKQLGRYTSLSSSTIVRCRKFVAYQQDALTDMSVTIAAREEQKTQD